MNTARTSPAFAPAPSASSLLPARRTAGADLAQAVIETPLGPLTALASPAGLLGLWFDDQRHGPGPLAAPCDAGQRWIAQARRELDEYFAGTRRRFEVPLCPQGSPFQEAVWRLLCEIGCGETTSYGRIAQALARPQGARAVGAAVGRNPISILVPCHRVLGGQGALTGYAGGLARKEALLALERAGAQAGLGGAHARRAGAQAELALGPA
jgi:methylated-DNA-[protein]-cysteine S-methyltransferase